jgi:hypothetical protein
LANHVPPDVFRVIALKNGETLMTATCGGQCRGIMLRQRAFALTPTCQQVVTIPAEQAGRRYGSAVKSGCNSIGTGFAISPCVLDAEHKHGATRGSAAARR